MIHDTAANCYVSPLKSYVREEGCHTGKDRRRGERRMGVEFSQSVSISYMLNHTSELTLIRRCNKNHKPLIKHLTAFTNCGKLVDIYVSNVHQTKPVFNSA